MFKRYSQMTLTGVKLKKAPFVQKPASLYDEFCNANYRRWTKDRKTFQVHVNGLWKSWKRKPEAEIRTFIEKLNNQDNSGSVSAGKQFVITKEGCNNNNSSSKDPEVEKASLDDENNSRLDGTPQEEMEPAKSDTEISKLSNLRGLDFICSHFGVQKDDLLSGDILQQESLVRRFASLGVQLKSFECEKSTWSGRTLHWEKSKIKEAVEKCQIVIKSLKQMIVQIASSELALDPRKSLMESEARKVQQKVDLIKHFFVESTTALPVLETSTRDLRNLNTKVLSHHIKYSPLEGRRFFGVNGLELCWNDAISDIRDFDSWQQVLISKEEAVGVATLLSSTNCQETKVLLKSVGVSKEIIENKRNIQIIATLLTKFLPVIHVFSSVENKSVLVNIHELVLGLGHDTLADLLLINKEEDLTDQEDDANSEERDLELVHQLNNKPGRKPFYVLYPGLPQVVLDFVSQQGSHAQERRRFDQSVSGSTLKEIRDHVKTVFPTLKKLNRGTIHKLFYPPREGTRNADKYHKILKVRVPRKSNNVRKKNAAAHYLQAQNGYIGEFCAEFSGQVAQYSADDMNKVMIGPPAVSRYHQIRKFFPLENSPDFEDHDFPTAKDYKLSVTGYMELTSVPSGENRKRRSYSEERSSNSQAGRVRFGSQDRLFESRLDVRQQHQDTRFTKDKHGRTHFRKKLVGPVEQVIRPAKENVNASTHKFEMEELVLKAREKGKVGAVFNVDGGPGYSVKHIPNFIEYADLFISSGLGFIIVHDCGAGLSAYNPVEAFWSFNCKQLTSVIFSDCVPGEDVAPAVQKDLSETQVEEKEKVVFDNAGEECRKLLDSKLYAGHKVKAEYEPYHGEKEKRNVERYESVHAFSEASLSQIKSGHHKQMLKLYTFSCKHTYRLRNILYVVACQEDDCQVCCSLPQSIKNAEPVKILKSMGGRLFSPEKSVDCPGSYHTYMELKEKYKKDQTALPDGDESYPGAEDLGMCGKGGCLGYRFNTKTDKERHIRLAHGGKVKFRQIDSSDDDDPVPAKKKTFMCSYQDCKLNFPSEWKLRNHKKEAGHKVAGGKGGRPKKK